MLLYKKSNEAFARFLRMSARAAAHVQKRMNELGHEVKVIEPGTLSSRIWPEGLRPKRRRVPDFFCVKCGRAIEVRSKSLKNFVLEMSHSQQDGRQWDWGLEDNDIVAFIACVERNGDFEALEPLNLVEVDELRSAHSKGRTILPRKAPSEGAELRIRWPATVARTNRLVTSTNRRARKYVWSLRGGTVARQGQIMAAAVTVHEQIECNFSFGADAWLRLAKSEKHPSRLIAAKVLRYRYSWYQQCQAVRCALSSLRADSEPDVSLEAELSQKVFDCAHAPDVDLSRVLELLAKHPELAVHFIDFDAEQELREQVLKIRERVLNKCLQDKENRILVKAATSVAAEICSLDLVPVLLEGLKESDDEAKEELLTSLLSMASKDESALDRLRHAFVETQDENQIAALAVILSACKADLSGLLKQILNGVSADRIGRKYFWLAYLIATSEDTTYSGSPVDLGTDPSYHELTVASEAIREVLNSWVGKRWWWEKLRQT